MLFVPKYADNVKPGLAAGLVYGAVLWLTLATFVMPFWVGAVTGANPPVPDVQPWSLVGHLLYGGFVGVLIPLYRRF